MEPTTQHNIHDVPTAAELAGALTAQHGMIRLGFHDTRHGSARAQATATKKLLLLLAMHEAAEQVTIHRMLERAGSGEVGIGEERTAEEVQAVQLIERLQEFEPTSYEHTMQLGLLEEAVTQHNAAEEATELPLLGDLDATERFRVGEALAAVITGLKGNCPIEYGDFSTMLSDGRSWLAAD
jgi:hypothetical protein